MKENKWIRLLAYMTGLVNQELLLQNEYLAAENRILPAHRNFVYTLENSPKIAINCRADYCQSRWNRAGLLAVYRIGPSLPFQSPCG
jgi:hypothetical protein